jgi:hypothetical protein
LCQVVFGARWCGLVWEIDGWWCWWVRGPAPVPGVGEAVRCLGIHPPRTWGVVCMERYGLSDCWAQSHMSARTTGGVMPMGELAAVTVPEGFMLPP